MTTYASNSVACGACGFVFECAVLTSTNRFGSPDLDTRPPVMQRHTMGAWIQRCPECGFCARDVTHWDDRFSPVLKSSEYQSQLANSEYPELASTFICAAMLATEIGAQENAAMSWLHAAWVLDDIDYDVLACECRSKAADKFLALLAEGEPIEGQEGAREAMTTDCLRRAGRGPEALQLIERTPCERFPDIIQKVLAFQRLLIEHHDTAVHTVQEAGA